MMTRLSRLPLFYWGFLITVLGLAIYFAGIVFALVRVSLQMSEAARHWNQQLLWYSGVPSTAGMLLLLADLVLMLPQKRRTPRWIESAYPVTSATVVLTAYNDEMSIADAVRDFRCHPLVRRVIVVSNGSTDRTVERAEDSGAIAINELRRGYGYCVYRCLQEALQYEDTECIILCEGDRTFRAQDINKLLAYLPHAEIVNGTRIVEQLRAYRTQLTTFMYYGNFIGGKLLELKHFGRGTFTDVGTTYKAVRPDALKRLLPLLNPEINLEFNAHFLDTALANRFIVIECPITFHPRVGFSKGGNTNNLRAIAVGFRMFWGMSFGWRRRGKLDISTSVGL